MKMCSKHWEVCKEAVKSRGMWDLVARNGEEAAENLMTEAQGGKAPFDPLMSMNNHWWGNALQNGGLYLMNLDLAANPENEGHYCPLCEYEKHSKGFDAKAAVEQVADQMLQYCRSERLVPQPS